MNIEQVKERIKEITHAIEQSAANHNGLLGRLNEAQHMLQLMEKMAEEAASVIQAVSEIV